jgi:transposase
LNVLKSHLRITIATLLGRGASQHEIRRRTGVDRKTIRRYAAVANSPMATGSDAPVEQIPPPRPPAPKEARSACEEHRAWIEEQVALGRNATAIYQDLVEQRGFAHRYNSVKRFVRGLKRREPERFDVLDSAPGEEAQVDFGEGAVTLAANGRYRRPFLFVMTLKYSGKSFRKVVWKADQETWARLHEEAFRTLGGAVAYVVLDFVAGNKIRFLCPTPLCGAGVLFQRLPQVFVPLGNITSSSWHRRLPTLIGRLSCSTSTTSVRRPLIASAVPGSLRQSNSMSAG